MGPVALSIPRLCPTKWDGLAPLPRDTMDGGEYNNMGPVHGVDLPSREMLTGMFAPRALEMWLAVFLPADHFALPNLVLAESWLC